MFTRRGDKTPRITDIVTFRSIYLRAKGLELGVALVPESF